MAARAGHATRIGQVERLEGRAAPGALDVPGAAGRRRAARSLW